MTSADSSPAAGPPDPLRADAGEHPTVRLSGAFAPAVPEATETPTVDLEPPSPHSPFAPEPAEPQPEVDRPAPQPPPPTMGRDPDPETVVIEADVIPRRLRRPIDLLRLASAFLTAAVILAVAYFASSAAQGFESDLTKASGRIPEVIVVAANVIGLLGVLALPLAAAFDLMLRRRGRMLAEALAGLAVAVLLTSAMAWLISRYPNPRLLLTLTGQETPGQLPPLNAILAGLVAFITIARLIERPRFGPISLVVVAAIVLANVVTGGITATALALSILIGWAVGLAMRYALGTPTTRPSGLSVATALEEVGHPVTVLRAHREFSAGRRYVATTRSGETLNVLVLDRDLEGAGVAASIWRTLRVRDDSAPSRMSMRRRLERTALQAYAGNASGAPTPQLLAAVQVNEDAALLAFPRIDGRTFDQIGADLTDADMDSAWRAVRTLHDKGITHRSLTGGHLLRDDNGKIWLLHSEDGAIAASDVAQRVDLAELLCTLSMLTTPDRAVASGERVLGPQRLVKALGVLQPIALSTETRKAIRKRKAILVELRDLLLEMSPNPNPEQVELERLRPRLLFTLVAGTVAGYILLTQLAQVNLATLLTDARWDLAFVALILSGLTYIAAAMALDGFVPERLQFLRTFQAQLAASFATLISPPTLGAVAVNLRYLQRAGVHPALGAASVGVSQVMAFVVHLLLLLGFGVIAGSKAESGFTPPTWAIFIIVGGLIAAVLLLLLPWSRRWITRRIRPIFQQVGPRLLTLLQQPRKLATGVGGIVLLNLGYIACLIACVWAFGGSAPLAAIAVVYLAGATIGQAAPTPGGLGAVEAALSAGLTAAGIPGGIAVSSVLLFRLATFWLPTIPGWFAFNSLQKNELL
ncbi:MAG: lysylphosphatidylglycerol synthase domain-containing protein [Candidatus Nanopelagicales bacterium]|nr:lysylphosphatidylglycerol synthase domain-containing protein [Candidatus Nanopelagicales bacterium]MCU0297144.1 lysylphosphatidylglycerol synthase domain-containing protein [Candidatus Nanopelagicales bacterium]